MMGRDSLIFPDNLLNPRHQVGFASSAARGSGSLQWVSPLSHLPLTEVKTPRSKNFHWLFHSFTHCLALESDNSFAAPEPSRGDILNRMGVELKLRERDLQTSETTAHGRK